MYGKNSESYSEAMLLHGSLSKTVFAVFDLGKEGPYKCHV